MYYITITMTLHHSAVSGGPLPLARAGLARGFSPAQPSTLAPAPGGGGGNEGPPAAASSSQERDVLIPSLTS